VCMCQQEDNIAHKQIMQSIPDFCTWQQAEVWLKIGREVQFLPNAQIVSLEWSDIAQNTERGPFGLLSAVSFRKFVLATYLADLVSYSNPIDQVSFDRLLFVMQSFPQGFRTWWMKHESGSWWPVGYTGWYPMLKTAFEAFKHESHRLTSRMVVPANSSYLYLFNFSASQTQKSLTVPLMTQFIADIKAQNPKGMACITVSDDGIRIAKRLGMVQTGTFSIENSPEGVFLCE
jgi:hypothetical protein